MWVFCSRLIADLGSWGQGAEVPSAPGLIAPLPRDIQSSPHLSRSAEATAERHSTRAPSHHPHSYSHYPLYIHFYNRTITQPVT